MAIGRWLGAWTLIWLAMLVFGTLLGSMPSARAQAPGDLNLAVVNGSQRKITKVFVSLSTDLQWGRDRLGETVVLRPGERAEIALRGACEWDAAVEYEDGQREERRNQNLCAIRELTFEGEQASPVLSDRGNPSVDVVNRSNLDIVGVYASLVSGPSWGQNRLGAGKKLAKGESSLIDLPFGQCLWNVRVDYADGRREVKNNQNLCRMFELGFDGSAAVASVASSAQDSGDPSFSLVNDSDRIILSAYASVATDQNWGDDLLGLDILAKGDSRWIALPEGQCLWNIMVVYIRGQQEIKRNQNLCLAFEVRFDGSAALAAVRSVAPPTPRNRSLELVNRSDRTIVSAYAFTGTDGKWGEDRLGMDLLESGTSFTIDLPQGQCRWNILVLYGDGQREEKRARDLCAESRLVFDGSGDRSADKPRSALPATPAPPTIPAQSTTAKNNCEGKEEARKALADFSKDIREPSFRFVVPQRVSSGSSFEVIASLSPAANMERLRSILPKIWCEEIVNLELRAELSGGGILRPEMKGAAKQPIDMGRSADWTWKVDASDVGKRDLMLVIHGVGTVAGTGNARQPEEVITSLPGTVEIEKKRHWLVEIYMDLLAQWGTTVATILATATAYETLRRLLRRRKLAGA